MTGGSWRAHPNTVVRASVGEQLRVRLKDGAGEVSGRVAMTAPDYWILVSDHGHFTVYTGAIAAVHRAPT